MAPGKSAALSFPCGKSSAGHNLQPRLVAIRAADLRPAAGPRLGKDGRTALTVARPGRIATGDLVVFLKPVAVAPAVVRRDGRVQAGGHPARHCQPPRRADPHLPRSCARRPGTPRRHRPRPAPRPENQGPARLPARRAALCHSQGSRRDQPLRADRRLTRPFPAIPADPWNRPPTRSANPEPAAALTHRDRHNEHPYSSTPGLKSPTTLNYMSLGRS